MSRIIKAMKKLLAFLILPFLAACDQKEVLPPTDSGNDDRLSNQEKLDLIFLREEEKLARDVYLYAYGKYNRNIFSNISSSEQNHTSSVLGILNMYELADPVTNNNVGVFTNRDLQSLYNDLIAKSESSLASALEVGATIEDLDINDIKTFRSHTTNEDFLNLYDKLTCGSRNHLRSFVKQSGTYNSSYISQSEYNSILSSSNEQCGQ